MVCSELMVWKICNREEIYIDAFLIIQMQSEPKKLCCCRAGHLWRWMRTWRMKPAGVTLVHTDIASKFKPNAIFSA